jgi:hypothetical protein
MSKNLAKVRIRTSVKAGSPSQYLNHSFRVRQLKVKTKIKAGFGNTDPSHSYGWDPVGQ